MDPVSTIRNICRPQASNFDCNRCYIHSLLCRTFQSKLQRQPVDLQDKDLVHPPCDNDPGSGPLLKGSRGEPFRRGSLCRTLPHHCPSQGTALVCRDRVCTPGSRHVSAPSKHTDPYTDIQTFQIWDRVGKVDPCHRGLLFPAGSTGLMV